MEGVRLFISYFMVQLGRWLGGLGRHDSCFACAVPACLHTCMLVWPARLAGCLWIYTSMLVLMLMLISMSMAMAMAMAMAFWGDWAR